MNKHAKDKEEVVVAPKDLELWAKVPEIEVFGNPEVWELLCKESLPPQGWMRSTKRMTLHNGAIYQTETQQRNPDGSYALSQATVFVPA